MAVQYWDYLCATHLKHCESPVPRAGTYQWQTWPIVNKLVTWYFFILSQLTQSSLRVVALEEINISHLGKRKIIFKMDFSGDILVPRRVNIDLRSTVLDFENRLLKYASNKTSTSVSAWKNNTWSQPHPWPHQKNPTSPSRKNIPISYILIILPVASILKIPESQAFPPKKEGDLRPKAITPGWKLFHLEPPRTPPGGCRRAFFCNLAFSPERSRPSTLV